MRRRISLRLPTRPDAPRLRPDGAGDPPGRRRQRDPRALAPGKRGIFNVAGPEPLPLSHGSKILGRPTLPVPYSIADARDNACGRFRLTSFPAPELDHIRYVCMVDDRRARDDLGYMPAHDAEETVRAVED